MVSFFRLVDLTHKVNLTFLKFSILICLVLMLSDFVVSLELEARTKLKIEPSSIIASLAAFCLSSGVDVGASLKLQQINTDPQTSKFYSVKA